MRIARGRVLAGIAAALFALLLAPALTGADAARAQSPPASYYGAGLDAGVVVTVMIGDNSCGTATADASGQWSITVQERGCDGAAIAGATVTFMIGDEAAKQTATWRSGFVPDDPANGITLTVAEAAMEEDGDDDAGASMTPPPAVPDTGNAGLASSANGTASRLALGLLGLMALAATAGARFATGRAR